MSSVKKRPSYVELNVLRSGIWFFQPTQHVFSVQCAPLFSLYPDHKVHGANIGPIWGRQDPVGPHVSLKIFAIWVGIVSHPRVTIVMYNSKTEWQNG